MKLVFKVLLVLLYASSVHADDCRFAAGSQKGKGGHVSIRDYVFCRLATLYKDADASKNSELTELYDRHRTYFDDSDLQIIHNPDGSLLYTIRDHKNRDFPDFDSVVDEVSRYRFNDLVIILDRICLNADDGPSDPTKPDESEDRYFELFEDPFIQTLFANLSVPGVPFTIGRAKQFISETSDLIGQDTCSLYAELLAQKDELYNNFTDPDLDPKDWSVKAGSKELLRGFRGKNIIQNYMTFTRLLVEYQTYDGIIDYYALFSQALNSFRLPQPDIKTRALNSILSKVAEGATIENVDQLQRLKAMEIAEFFAKLEQLNAARETNDLGAREKND